MSFGCLSTDLHLHDYIRPSHLINNMMDFGSHGYREKFEAVAGAVMLL